MNDRDGSRYLIYVLPSLQNKSHYPASAPEPTNALMTSNLYSNVGIKYIYDVTASGRYRSLFLVLFLFDF